MNVAKSEVGADHVTAAEHVVWAVRVTLTEPEVGVDHVFAAEPEVVVDQVNLAEPEAGPSHVTPAKTELGDGSCDGCRTGSGVLVT